MSTYNICFHGKIRKIIMIDNGLKECVLRHFILTVCSKRFNDIILHVS